MTFKSTFSLLISSLFVWGLSLNAQILATFEDDHEDHLELSNEWFDSSLFVSLPAIYANPDTTGINSSAKCFGAANVASADWWGNFICLKMDTATIISSSNRFLSFMMYRSIQPKEVLIGFNGWEESDEIFFGKATENARWQKISIDLFSKYEGQELDEIWIILSCNWTDPRTGWGEASYFFDSFELTGTGSMSKSVVIDPGISYQEIEGFGASDCWTGNFVGQWSENTRQFVADKLFSREYDDKGNPEGIGLSMWRFNLGAGTYEQGDASGIEDMSRRSESFFDEAGNYDWTKQAGQQYFLNQAKASGCEQFVAFSISPPTLYTKNGLGFADPGGLCNLAENHYESFAEYTTTVLEHFSENGIKFSYISPLNEPQYDWTGGQEGSPWENSDINKITEHLDASLQAKKLDTKILLAEAGSWTDLYKSTGRASNQIYELFNSGSTNYVGNLPSVAQAIAGHSYWTHQTNQEIKDVRLNVGNQTESQFLKSHQTEWSLLGNAPDVSTGFPVNYDQASYMDIALFMAKVIQGDLNFAHVSSWSYWAAMDRERWGHKNRFFLIRVTPSDGAYGSMLNSGTAEDTPTLWALGNFSRFIRPGYIKIGMEGADEMNALFGSAYISPDTGRIVAVYVNTSYSDIKLSTDFRNLDFNIKSVRSYVTSSSSRLERDLSLSESYSEEILSLPARSASTIVYDLDKEVTAIQVHPNKQAEIRIYPNPVSPGSDLTIIIPGLKPSSNSVFEFLSTDGRLVKNVRIRQEQGSYRLSLPGDLSKGIYILNLKNDNRSESFKIIVD